MYYLSLVIGYALTFSRKVESVFDKVIFGNVRRFSIFSISKFIILFIILLISLIYIIDIEGYIDNIFYKLSVNLISLFILLFLLLLSKVFISKYVDGV